MCQEFHCDCCPDNLPQIDCVCKGCFHDNESIKEKDVNKDQVNPDLAKGDTVLQDGTRNDGEEGQCYDQVAGIEAPSCCKGENVGKNPCCEQDVVKESECCAPKVQPDTCEERCSQNYLLREKEKKKRCLEEQCCLSKKQLSAMKSSSVERCSERKVSEEGGKTDNSCCSSQEKKPCGTTSSCAAVENPGKKPCCSFKNEPSCSGGGNAKFQSLSLQEKSQATLCADQDDKCCEKNKNKGDSGSTKVEVSCCKDKEETVLFLEPSGEKSRATCCTDKDDKCCEKEDEGECVSTEVEVSCCKVNEETVLLIEPCEKQPDPESSSLEVKTKGTLPRRHTTKLRVQNICCAMEAQLVQECLKPLQGVENVAVNVIGRVVHVRHDPDVTSPTELVESLNRVHLGATVMEMGAHHDKDNDQIPCLFKLRCIYLLIQTCLLITAIAGHFLKQPWYMWVAIAEIIFGGAPILKHAFFSAKNRKVDINILMLIAIIGTLAISEWVEGATVVYVFAFADALQEFCMFRVQRTISRLMLKRPEVAVLVETGKSVPIESVAIGTLIAVRPGELIPLDGVVAKGKAAVDESSITGESLPVEKTAFSKVYSGTVNQNGYIEVETTSDSSTSTVSKVAQMVQEAQSSSSKTEATINRFAKYYTPLVVVVAALVVVVPAILGAAGVGNYLEEIREWGQRALVILVIACPCALVMATPIAVVCSITAAARKGALVKGGEHLETLSKIEVLAFDKTGTLTEGKFQVMNMECAYGENERDVLRLAAGLESKSVHPIAAAIVNEFSGCVAEMVKNQVISLPEVTQFKMYEGKGISGLIEGKLVRVGNKEMVDQCGASLTEAMAEKYELWSSESKTVVFVCVNERLSLMIALADAIRPNTSTSLDWLRNIGVQTSMITGDNSRTADAVSRNLGLDECVSEMKPHVKLEWIQEKQKSKMAPGSTDPPEYKCQSCKLCRRSRDPQLMVGMVGDGVNDGPALAAANVGIAMGAGGTALAVEAADVALMSNNLAKIPELICLAKFCSLIVKQNIVFSVLLKIIIVIVALSGYVTLWMAVVADVLGLLFVIINGLRPLIWKASKKHTKGNKDIELVVKKRARSSYTYESIV
ncbi:cadmium/zinc-transporting ATPase HMA3-like [Actinia tenebrosa]|uniref:P-type Cu(+) transporter n=1 Tax=Actinia tenebrosa TaxID=6105 RepID=A0A6P8I517_ACTTE|nr:cadmium/zinc-transporting ATPase HMA3-like [Actinia tenebrosa]XP_031562993.1 cadmium/zinc-transporting ATPase HMA3-like [Actinia tenebrosa]